MGVDPDLVGGGGRICGGWVLGWGILGEVGVGGGGEEGVGG